MNIATPLTPNSTRVLLLGSGELGKEVVIELQRFGVEVIAADRYANAPAMQVAHRSHVLDMLDPQALRALIAEEKPDLVVPEIEAIHTPTLVELEAEGLNVIPTARAARLTMDREGIRRLAAETLGLPTSPYRFCDTEAEYRAAIAEIGVPCVVKPVMSSSGKGQSTVKTEADIERAWNYAQTGGRAVVDDLGGRGIFGVELFVKGDEVWFSEVSPRPHDTGLITLISQELPQFALHARAILGLPIPVIRQLGPSASCAIVAEGHGVPQFKDVDAALVEPDTALRLFGKPVVQGSRRVAVTLARGADTNEARAKATTAASAMRVELV